MHVLARAERWQRRRRVSRGELPMATGYWQTTERRLGVRPEGLSGLLPERRFSAESEPGELPRTSARAFALGVAGVTKIPAAGDRVQPIGDQDVAVQAPDHVLNQVLTSSRLRRPPSPSTSTAMIPAGRRDRRRAPPAPPRSAPCGERAAGASPRGRCLARPSGLRSTTENA